MPDWTLSRYMLHYQSCAVCPCPCCMSMSIMHVHVHVACPCQCCMSMSMSMDIYIEMPECWTVRHPVSPVPDWKKLTMPEQVRYRTKLTQSGIFLVRYQTKIRDAGMTMPALVSSMPMPSYVFLHRCTMVPVIMWAEFSKLLLPLKILECVAVLFRKNKNIGIW